MKNESELAKRFTIISVRNSLLGISGFKQEIRSKNNLPKKNNESAKTTWIGKYTPVVVNIYWHLVKDLCQTDTWGCCTACRLSIYRYDEWWMISDELWKKKTHKMLRREEAEKIFSC